MAAQIIASDREASLAKATAKVAELEAVESRTPMQERQLASWRRSVAALSAPLPDDVARVILVGEARRLLAETDYQDGSWRQGKTPERLAAADAYRNDLRRVARGELNALPVAP